LRNPVWTPRTGHEYTTALKNPVRVALLLYLKEAPTDRQPAKRDGCGTLDCATGVALAAAVCLARFKEEHAMVFRLSPWWRLTALATAVLLALIGGSALSQVVRPALKATDLPQPPGIKEASAATSSAEARAGQRSPSADKATAAGGSSAAAASKAEPRPTPARRPPPGSTPSETISSDQRSTSETVLKSAEPKLQKDKDEEPLSPIPDLEESGPVEVEAASFKGIAPGAASLADVEKAWGAPKEVRKRENAITQLYSVPPFERVEVNALDDKITSVIIRFEHSFPANDVAQQLDLSKIRPVLVSNELGEILGQAYPERGVLFAFEPSKDPGKPSVNVAHIILEPLSAELFVLRAENTLDSRPKSSRQDLEQALKLEPKSARALWLYARALTTLGEYEKALTASSDAVRLDPDNPRYRVARAQVLGHMGRLPEAMLEAQRAVDTAKSRPHVQARALCLLGDLTASGPKPDYKKAIQFHTEAVKVADPVSVDRYPAVRLAAREVLVDAHLGAAHDIAWGDWKEKGPAVTRWLERAAAAADDLSKNDGGSQEPRFRVTTRALAACVGLRGALDPGPWANNVISIGEELIGATHDPLRKALFQWDLGMALYDAVQVYQMRGDHETAVKYGEAAVRHLEQGDPQKQSPVTAYLLGRLYFRLGAIHALRDQNHRAAITWFDKAVPLLQKPLPREALADQGRHGETYVSMGVSYWESGQREKAVELTQHGVTLMEQAVKQGLLNDSALAIPYGNLAAMHRQLGASEQAKRFEELEARLRTSKLR
jgi:tetratricopeptide (TPR) repeat protein